MTPFHYDGKEYTGKSRNVTIESLDFAQMWLSCYEPSEDEGEERAQEIANLLAWLDKEIIKRERKGKK